MFKNKKKIVAYIIMIAVFSTTFSIGIIGNPNFDIREFCSGLTAEFLGMTFALTVVEIFVSERLKDRRERERKNREDE